MNQALLGDDDFEFSQADQAAKALGIETWEHHWRRWQAQPTDSGRWFHVVWQVDEGRFAQVLQAALNTIDLAAVATGPSDELGLGPGYDNHSRLDYLLQELPRFPGQGGVFIEAGLKSPVVRNRNLAVAALAKWQSEHQDSVAFETLRAAEQVEPDDDLRQRMAKVLNGESSEN